VHEDHCEIRDLLLSNRNARWVVSYDDVPEIRDIYAAIAPVTYALNYTAGTKTTGNEVIYFSDAVAAPSFAGFVRQAA
jgi:DNA adenine methylase